MDKEIVDSTKIAFSQVEGLQSRIEAAGYNFVDTVLKTDDIIGDPAVKDELYERVEEAVFEYLVHNIEKVDTNGFDENKLTWEYIYEKLQNQLKSILEQSKEGGDNLQKELYMFSQSVYGVINNLSDKEYLEKERDRLYNLVSSGLEEVNKLFSGEKE